MSYILDALKKAQAESDPDVRTSLAAEMREKRRYRNLLLLIGLALLGNALVLIYIFAPGPWQRNTPDAQEISSIETGEISSANPPAIESGMGDATQRPASQSALNSAPVGTATPAASSSTPLAQIPRQATRQPPAAPPPGPVRTTLSGLPADVRNRLPGLAFSTHVYASDPELRAVVVNGQRLVEGDRLDSLRLQEITETGVILRFENYLVAVPVLEDWE